MKTKRAENLHLWAIYFEEEMFIQHEFFPTSGEAKERVIRWWGNTSSWACYKSLGYSCRKVTVTVEEGWE